MIESFNRNVSNILLFLTSNQIVGTYPRTRKVSDSPVNKKTYKSTITSENQMPINKLLLFLLIFNGIGEHHCDVPYMICGHQLVF